MVAVVVVVVACARATPPYALGAHGGQFDVLLCGRLEPLEGRAQAVVVATHVLCVTAKGRHA